MFVTLASSYCPKAVGGKTNMGELGEGEGEDPSKLGRKRPKYSYGNSGTPKELSIFDTLSATDGASLSSSSSDQGCSFLWNQSSVLSNGGRGVTNGANVVVALWYLRPLPWEYCLGRKVVFGCRFRLDDGTFRGLLGVSEPAYRGLVVFRE